MRHANRTHRLRPGLTVALALAGLALVTLRATSTPQAQEDFYYFDGKPVPLTRSQTEVVVHYARGAESFNRLAERTPNLQTRWQSGDGERSFDVVSVSGLTVNMVGPLAGLSATFGQRSAASPLTAQAQVGPSGSADQVNRLLEALRIDPEVDFVAPVFHYPATGIRILPTDELVVRLQPGDSGNDLANVVSGYGLRVDRTLDGMNDVFVLRMIDGKSRNALEISRDLHESGRFQWAEPNFIQQYQKFDTPNDPLFANQWHLKNTGQGGGTVGADSKVDQAWDIQPGSSNIVIAVIDDGMEKTHEDLSAALFTNPGEVAANGIDDDANGRIDDVNGWDFFNNDNNVTPTAAADNHGTSVAGVAAARGNNAIGVAGACRNCRILPVKIFENAAATNSTNLANAITYAALFADVINNSWGGGSPSAAIQTAISNANTSGRGGKGAMVLFATGNSASGLLLASISGWPAGNFGYQLEYFKDAAGAGGSDTAWVPWMLMPGGAYVDFSSGIPSGWTTGGNVAWSSVTDPSHSDEGICLTKTGKAGTIGNSQTSTVQRANLAVGAGTWYIYLWVSSAAGDGLRVKYDGNNDGSFETDAFGLISMNPAVVQTVAYPAAHPESIAVGATTNRDCRSYYSEFGPEVAFVAPSNGGPLNLGITTTDRTGAAGYDAGSNYNSTFGGTSSATPLASGIAGLILSRAPGMSRANALSIMKSTANKVGPEPYDAGGTGRNDRYGHGRLNAFAALQNTPVVPGAPTNVGGIAGNAQVSVSFLPPASTGGSAITQYTATASPGGAFNTGAGSPIVVSGLTNGVGYTFTVTATNIAGTGPASVASNQVTPTAGPGAFGKTTPANAQAGQPLSPVLSWSAASGATSYEYCIDNSNNNACNSTWVNVGTSTNSGNLVTGLAASTSYYWHVRANNAGGTTYAEGNSLSFWAFTTAAASGPFGQVDTPTQNAAGVQGAIGVTGWTLDDNGVNKVEIFRNCLGGADAPNCQIVLGQNVVYIGDAAFVPGARPDVEAAYPTHPFKNRAGWGYLMLTPMLPIVNPPSTFVQAYGGVGPLTIYAIASDGNGNKKILGRTSNVADNTPTAITMTNDTIAKPFGAIDTPGQGQTISGMFNNFGWVLTPDLNTTGGEGGDILMPTNGSTITVYIDGVPKSTVAYNQCRGTVGNPVPGGSFCNDDVANIFGNTVPAAPNTARASNPTKHRNLDAGRGAIGAYTFNTALYSDGLHSIAWGVSDSAARGEGIGSRNFIVQNAADAPLDAARVLSPASTLSARAAVTSGVYGRTGYDLAAPWISMRVADTGRYAVRLPETGRLELWLGPVEAGYMVANGTLRPLPVGSTLGDSMFSWMPPVGFLGSYELAFIRGGERIDVTVTVVEKAPVRDDEAQIRMGLDDATLAAGSSLETRTVRLNGWAFDPQASIGSGIVAVHVWARRVEGDGAAMFLGAAELNRARPDVAGLFSDAPSHTGFSLDATLPRGTFIVTAYVWNERTGRWEDARSIRVAVR